MNRGPTAPVEQQDVERLADTLDALLAEVHAIKHALGIVTRTPIDPPVVSVCTCGMNTSPGLRCPVHSK